MAVAAPKAAVCGLRGAQLTRNTTQSRSPPPSSCPEQRAQPGGSASQRRGRGSRARRELTAAARAAARLTPGWDHSAVAQLSTVSSHRQRDAIRSDWRMLSETDT